MKSALWLCKDYCCLETECRCDNDDELCMARRPQFLSYNKDAGVSSQPADVSTLSLEEMYKFLDQDADDCDAHDFVGTHEALAKLLSAELAHTDVCRIFRRLIDYHGLHGISVSYACDSHEQWREIRNELGLAI